MTAGVLPAPADQLLPTFTYERKITVAEELSYNPTGEFIFPSVFPAGEYLDNPLGQWYLYYAPHENPGGISLMYADSLDGPWTEYAANPLIANQWSPHYSVNHVSSPDAIWDSAGERVLLYFHGGNDQTRVASSADGITFEYEGTAVDNAMGGPGTTETSYARVFEHPDPSSPYAYAMFYMDNTTANTRRIRTAESVDGLAWVVRPDPIVTSGSVEGGNVSSANLWTWRGQLYVIYHGSTGRIYARTIDETLSSTGPTLLLHRSSGIGDDVGRTASPEVVATPSRTYLFYEAGGRLDATIALAVSDETDDPFDVALSAGTRCVNGVAAVVASATNHSAVPIDIRLTTSFAERKFTSVAPGATVAPTLSSGAAVIDVGTVTASLFARIDGMPYYGQRTVTHSAMSC
jgi:hypothetical protein